MDVFLFAIQNDAVVVLEIRFKVRNRINKPGPWLGLFYWTTIEHPMDYKSDVVYSYIGQEFDTYMY
jgi:hypothetical protein